MKKFSLKSMSFLLTLILVSCAFAQLHDRTQTDDPEITRVKEMVRQANQEAGQFEKEGGKEIDARHPNRKWSAALWKYREENPGTDAAALATAESLHLLVHADGSAEALTKANTLKPDDKAWKFLLGYLQEASHNLNDYTFLNNKLQQLIQTSSDSSVVAAANYHQGLFLKRLGENDKAKKAFQAALTGNLTQALAEEARGHIAEMESLNIGQAAPIFAARKIDGAPLSLSNYKGKVVLLSFWSTSCPVCLSEIPMLKNLQSQHKNNGLVILGISLDEDSAKLQDAVSKRGITWTQLYDGKGFDGAVARLFNVRGTPSHFVIDRNGKIAAKRVRGEELSKVVANLLSK